MNVDIQKLKRGITSIESDIRSAKSRYRRPSSPESEKEKAERMNNGQRAYFEHLSLRDEATLMYAVRAHLRGRIHRQGDTIEQQAEFVGSAWQRWGREELPEPTGSSATVLGAS